MAWSRKMMLYAIGGDKKFNSRDDKGVTTFPRRINWISGNWDKYCAIQKPILFLDIKAILMEQDQEW